MIGAATAPSRWVATRASFQLRVSLGGELPCAICATPNAISGSGSDLAPGSGIEAPVPTVPVPSVIGHRGAAAHAPENTLAGIREGARRGAPWVEFDVKLTADGVPILMHDDRLDRTTDGTGPVAGRSRAEIAQLDAGTWFSPRFAGESVPDLAQALALCVDLGLGVNIEIKPCAGRARETARNALALAQRVWPADRAPPLVSSFERESLDEALRCAPSWPRGLLLDAIPPDWRVRFDGLRCATVHAAAASLDGPTLAALRAAGPVLAYTVNDSTLAGALFDRGVTGVFTDRPDEIAPVAEARRAPQSH